LLDDQAMERGGLLMRSRRSMVATLAQKIVTPGLSFAITVLLARGLSKQEYGVYGVFQGMLPYAALASSLGLAYVFLRFIPEYHTRGDDGLVKRLVNGGVALRLAAGVVTLILALVFYRRLGAFFHVAGYRDLFAVFCLAMLVMFEATLLSQALNALFLHAYAVAAQVAYTVVKAGLLAMLVVSGHLNLKGAVWLEVVSAAVILTGVALAFQRQFGTHVASTSGLAKQRRRLARYAGFSVLNDAGSAVFSLSTDLLVIGHFLGATAVAPYYLASQLVERLGKLNPVVGFQTVVTPMFFTKYAGDRARTTEMYRLLTKLSLFVIVPLVCVYPILGRQFVELVGGARYHKAFLLVGILIALGPVDAFAYPTGLVLQALERVDHVFYSRFFALYNLGASIVLVQRFGLVGAAVATASAVTLKNAYLTFWAVRLGGVSIPWGAILRLVTNSAVAAAVAFVVSGLVGGTAALVGGGILSVAAFLAVGRVNRVFTADEGVLINRLLGRRAWFL
jgi:O-antigen/teichoic acid export membrane protein